VTSRPVTEMSVGIVRSATEGRDCASERQNARHRVRDVHGSLTERIVSEIGSRCIGTRFSVRSLPGGALLDPNLEQAEFFRCQPQRAPTSVVLWRHQRFTAPSRPGHNKLVCASLAMTACPLSPLFKIDAKRFRGSIRPASLSGGRPSNCVSKLASLSCEINRRCPFQLATFKANSAFAEEAANKLKSHV